MGRTTSLLVFAISLWLVESSHAGGISWRHDYREARQMAARAGRPLLIDFGTEVCFWCKKLDATTFRVPAIEKLINDHFIAVKVDGNQNPSLTQSLSVSSFPTLVLASPEGKVLGRHEGYVEANALTQLLGQVLAKMPAPKKQIIEAAGPIAPPQPTPLTMPAPDADLERLSRARRLLVQARADFDDQCYLACLERCRLIATRYANSPEAEEARSLAQRVTKTADEQSLRNSADGLLNAVGPPM